MENIANWVGISALGLAVIAMLMVKGAEHWRKRVLIAGVFLILLAASAVWSFNVMIDWLGAVPTGNATPNEIKVAKSIANVWLYIFPATAAAMGLQLIINWYQAKKP